MNPAIVAPEMAVAVIHETSRSSASERWIATVALDTEMRLVSRQDMWTDQVHTQNHSVSTATLGRFRGGVCCGKASLLRLFPGPSKAGDGAWDDPLNLS